MEGRQVLAKVGLAVAVVSVGVGFSMVLLRLTGLSPAGSLYRCRSACVKVSVREICVQAGVRIGASLPVDAVWLWDPASSFGGVTWRRNVWWSGSRPRVPGWVIHRVSVRRNLLWMMWEVGAFVGCCCSGEGGGSQC